MDTDRGIRLITHTELYITVTMATRCSEMAQSETAKQVVFGLDQHLSAEV